MPEMAHFLKKPIILLVKNTVAKPICSLPPLTSDRCASSSYYLFRIKCSKYWRDKKSIFRTDEISRDTGSRPAGKISLLSPSPNSRSKFVILILTTFRRKNNHQFYSDKFADSGR